MKLLVSATMKLFKDTGFYAVEVAMARLNEIALRRLIKGGETATVEFKVAVPRPVEMAERLCGMANAQGGMIIIGVEDAERKVVGVPEERMALTKDVIVRATRQIIKPALVLDPPEPEIYEIDGKQLVVATVPSNNGSIYQSGGVCWVRLSTHTVPLSVSELIEMANDRALIHWELLPARNAVMEDIDLEKVEVYLRRRSMGGRQTGRFEDIEQVLIGMECAVVVDGKVVPTNAGILFFGHEPQMRIMQSEIDCVLFRGAMGASRYTDKKVIMGTVQELIDGAETFLRSYMPVEGKVEGWKRVDIPEYPVEALREALVNAVIHRDYSRYGESIRVFYYADRIEIHSPGMLLPGVTVEQMAKGEVQSRLRNPVLANLLRDVPGYMERIGSGIRFMLDETRRVGLPAPQFREMSEFIVTFRSAAISPGLRTRELRMSETLWDDEQLPPLPTSAEELSDQERRLAKAIVYVHEHGFITNGLYREITGTTEKRAFRDLEVLVERGRLKRMGSKRGRRYELP
ncbi:MAG TPA: ATP-binding protein [Ktedonobacteraceae bacterium]|nr:ATP-binding protein [Ktedonobacteraceae bacterium]